jgi:CheY-like chemotaxis protein
MLSVVLTHSQLMLSDLPKGEPMREDVEQMLAAGRRAAEITRRLLAFSRQQVFERRPVNVNALISDWHKTLSRLLGADVEVTLALSTQPWQVLADPAQLEQVLVNLVLNSRDAMPSGGRITIQTANVFVGPDEGSAELPPGSYALISFSDNGTGMSPDVQDKVFDPFFTTKEAGTGTGLGLSTVFGIVKQSGGHIEVQSTEGQGTTFRVSFPRFTGTHSSARRTSSAILRSVRGGETILVVEYEELVRRAAENTLRRAGYTVLVASDPTQALTLAERYTGPVHLLLADVVLPTMSGVELAERVCQARQETSVLYLSGNGNELRVRHRLPNEDAPILQKPLTPRLLNLKVRAVLDGK